MANIKRLTLSLWVLSPVPRQPGQRGGSGEQGYPA